MDAKAERAADIQTEKILIDGLEIGENFLNLIDHIMDIVLGKFLNFGIRNSIGEIYEEVTIKN